MATGIVLGTPKATPHCLRYLTTVDITNPDAQASLTVTQATLVADAAAGPLKEILRRPSAAQWAALQSGAEIPGVIPTNVVSVRFLTNDPVIVVGVAPSGAAFRLLARLLAPPGSEVVEAVFELRYNHSIER